MVCRRTLVRALLVLALVLASAAADGLPAHGDGGGPKSGKSSKQVCSSSIAGCKSCSENGCKMCKKGATLSGGECYCQRKWGQYGTPNTVPPPPKKNNNAGQKNPAHIDAAPSIKRARGSRRSKATKHARKHETGGGGGGKGQATSSHACAPCAADSYAARKTRVSSARCIACPAGTTSPDRSYTCFVKPGFYYDSTSGTVKQCGVDNWCPGGDFQSAGRDQRSCPAGSTTAAIGANTINQCVVPAGSYYDETLGAIQTCPVNSYCPGGSIGGGGASPVKCPQGTTFPATGASTVDECIIEPGFYWTGASVAQCPANKYCVGGPVTGSGAVANECDASTLSPAGSDSKADCKLSPGYFCVYPGGGDACTVTRCRLNSYCNGGASITAGPGGGDDGRTLCPGAPNTYSAVGSDDVADCKLSPGYTCTAYIAGVCTKVDPCPPNKYCPGRASVTDAASANCKLNPGFYCIYDGNVVCAVTQCPASHYCPGSASVADPTTPGGPIPCPNGQTSAAGASGCTEALQCSDGRLYCSSTCIDPQTDSTNCGSCGSACIAANEACIGGSCACGYAGNVCPMGSTCQLLGATQTPTCVCINNGVAVSAPNALTCGLLIDNEQNVKVWELDVTPGQTYTLNYNAYSIPDRFVVADGPPCGPVLIDTSFVGLTSSGCPESAPCCVTGSGAGCTGTADTVCPAGPPAILQPGGGAGEGSYTFVPTASKISVVGYGVCSSTASDFIITCPT